MPTQIFYTDQRDSGRVVKLGTDIDIFISIRMCTRTHSDLTGVSSLTVILMNISLMNPCRSWQRSRSSRPPSPPKGMRSPTAPIVWARLPASGSVSSLTVILMKISLRKIRIFERLKRSSHPNL